MFRHSEQQVLLHRQTLSATAYRLARDLGISNDFNDVTVTAGHDRLICGGIHI